VVAFARPKWHELEGYTFEQYASDFGRGYEKNSAEWKMREAIFYAKLKVMIAHNKDSTNTWRRGVNQFTDLTESEWRMFNRAYKSPNRPKPTEILAATGIPKPVEIDYRTWTAPRVLTDVKHQGSCGSCWAHSATESIESYYALATGLLPVLSVQQITACVAVCQGCNGGDAVDAYKYINSSFHGQTEEWAYPYSNFFYDYTNPNATTDACVNTTKKFPNKHPYNWFADLTRAGVTGYTSVTPNSAAATLEALATRGPLSISVAAGNWQDYETGVFQNSNSTGSNNEWGIDHDVQMVGYGHDGDLNMDYWIVRNSWSTLWGDAGYIRLARPSVEPCSPQSFGPVCGTSGCLNDPHFPHVKKNPGQPF